MRKRSLLILLLLAGEAAAQDSSAIKTRDLQTVSVQGRKKTIELKGDRIVVNVANSVNAMGMHALDLLRQSPGVIVDPQGGISLNGKAGVNVYIDGKPAYMTGDALTALLRSLQSANIQSIELIPNPSGKYDAAGSGGIINIRLKKLTAEGYNGNISAGLHFGETPKTEAAFNGNYKTGKFNFYGNYNHHFGYRNMQYDFYRVQQGRVADNRTIDRDMRNPINMKAGADYQVNSHHSLGVMMNANLFMGKGLTHTFTQVTDSATGAPLSMLNANNDYYSQRQNWSNYNFRHQYHDTSGRTLTTDIDYGHYKALIKNILFNQFLAADGETETGQYTLRTINGSNIDIYGIKTDFEQPVRNGKFSAGAKVSAVLSGNSVNVFDVVGGKDEPSYARNNRFRYDELIYAGYLQMEKQFGKWKATASLRGEQTDADGTLRALSTATGTDTTQQLRNNYFSLFPSIHINWQAGNNHQFSLFYNRKIDRPSYANLNPFEYQMDELSFWKGNPFLQPQFANSITLGWQAGNILMATASYTHTKDMFSQITDTIGTHKMVITPQNLGSQDLFTLNVSSNQDIAPWWHITASANGFYRSNRISFDPSRQATLSATTAVLNLQQSFDIDKKTQAEVSGFYRSAGLSAGFQRSEPMWQVNIGVQRKVLKDKGMVRIGVSDVFKSFRWASTRDFAGMYYRTQGSEDTRLLKLGFSYRFGGLKASGDRQTGLETESKRVK